MANRPRSSARRAVLVVAVVGATVVVMWASTSGDGGRTAGADGATVDRVAFGQLGALIAFVIFTVLLGAAVLVVLQMLASADPGPSGPGRDDDPEVPVWVRRLITAGQVAFGVVAAYVLYQAFPSLHLGPLGSAAGAGDDANAAGAGAAANDALFSNLLAAVILLAALSLVAGAVIIFVIRLRNRLSALDEQVPPEVTPAVSSWAPDPEDPFALDPAVFAAGAPRDAIIATFDHATTLLRAGGFPPAWGETAAEHVRRITPSLPARSGAAARTLLAAYHEAKFSTHPLVEDQRLDAIDALRVLRDDLLVVATSRSTVVAATAVTGPT